MGFLSPKISLIAFDINSQIVKWTFGEETMRNYPVVDSDGNIYLLTKSAVINNKHSLYSLYPDGSIRWIFEHNYEIITKSASPISINKSGDVFFAFDTLYCIDYYGNLVFKENIGGVITPGILIDSNENLYFTILTREGKTVAASFDQHGNELWKNNNLDIGFTGYAGCITDKSQWIFPSYQYTNQIFSIK